MDGITSEPKKRSSFLSKIIFVAVLCVIFILGSIFLIPPKSFPVGEPVQVSRGDSVQGFANKLETLGYIKNAPLFTAIFVSLGGDHALAVGFYSFDHPLGVFSLAKRFHAHDFGIDRVKITFPEGMTRYEMAKLIPEKFPALTSDAFMEETVGKEGYLFPDTYYFFFTATAKEIADTLEKTFTSKMMPYEEVIAKSGHSEKDIITMASIIEKEANGEEDSKVIAGILWKRISIGMPLQVDATFSYLLGKSSSELTVTDLATDSPYNTYTHTGLPPGPIGNPGILSIESALYPEASDYLYYLHDAHGIIHYAKDFEEHKRNKALYLN